MIRPIFAVILICGGSASAAEPERVVIPAGGTPLQASFSPTAADVSPQPAIVALHGCGGPWGKRDRQWQALLGADGHATLFPDSFGSRGLGSQCKVVDRTVRPGRERRADAVAAVRWLMAQPGTPAGGVFVMGWSNGGSTVLAAAAEGVMPAGSVRGFIAFYPGCSVAARRQDWAPSAPLLILIGAEDDWTPAAPCRALAAKFPDRITLVEYPGAYHDFDVPGRIVAERGGLAYTAGGRGSAHTGTDATGRKDAISRVLAFTRQD